MKLFNRFFSGMMLAISPCSVPAFADEELKEVFVLPVHEKSWSKNVNDVYLNDNLQVIWHDGISTQNEQGQYFARNILFYLDQDLEDPINITDEISKKLLEFGYKPKAFYTPKDCKPWDCSYSLEYSLNHISYLEERIDKFGNILLNFTCEDPLYNKHAGGNQWLNGICVWNKDYGVKVIGDYGFNVNIIKKTNDFLAIETRNRQNTQKKASILSIKNGYWGELIQPKPQEEFQKNIKDNINQLENELYKIKTELAEIKEKQIKIEKDQEKSWWDKNKPTWLSS